jgi:putative Holliday junction resolvase
MRYLGLDIGDRWIGVAVSDPSAILASPLTIIQRTREADDLAAVNDIIRQHEIGKVIVGLPHSLNGSLGPQAEKVQQFADSLEQHIEVPLEYRDERLTTVSAQKLMRQSAGKRKVKTRDDAVAAALILQGFLDEAHT